MEKKNITVKLAGQNFQMTTSEEPEYIAALAERVDKRIEKLRNAHPKMSFAKCILLALLNAENELGKVQASYESLSSKLSRLREISKTSGSEYPTRKASYKKPSDE